MAATILPETWRLEAEMFCGTETFRNHQDIKWDGTGADVNPGPSAGIVSAWVSFLRAVYYSDVTINTVFLRNIFYKPGAPPHPDHPPIWTDSVAAAGEGETTFGGAHNSNYLPQEVCIFCKKITSAGRNGKMFMRNILTEVDVQSTIGGVWAFSPGAGHFQTTVFDAAANTILGPYMTDAPSDPGWGFAVTHLEGIADADSRTPYSTFMTGFQAIRPTWNKTQR